MGSSERADAVQVTEGPGGREGGKQQMGRGSHRCRIPEHENTGENTDWAGTKGKCVAWKGTGMGHCLSNIQESKSCENVSPSANNLQHHSE